MAETETKRRSFWPYAIGTILLFLFVVGRMMAPESSKPRRPPLLAEVRASALQVRITNSDHQDWNNVRAMVNEKYFCHAVSIDEGKFSDVPLATCVSVDGQRFVPLTMGVRHVLVSAMLAQDGGEASAAFLLSP